MSEKVDLDAVLSAPLAEIPDNGFSDAVTLRAMEMQARRARLIMEAVAGVIVLVCLVMPFTVLGQSINRWMLDLVEQMSMPLAVVAGTLVFSGLLVQLFSDAIGSGPTSRGRPSS